MEEKWYMSPEGIKEKFEECGEFDNLKEALLYDGIIFEYQFGGITTSSFLRYSKKALNELFGEHEEFKKRNYFCMCHEVENQGWMCCLFDMNSYDFDDVQTLIEYRFSQDS